MANLDPFRLGPVELVAPIGRGGMGEVWRGHHLDLGRPVAVKVLHSQDTAYRVSFRNEVRAVAALSHPHIISIFEHGRVQPDESRASGDRLLAWSPYLVMELAEDSLLPWCGRMPWTATRAVLRALLEALAHAHARELMHGDLKPGNVLTVAGTIKLTDFGLARRFNQHIAPLTTMGTPRYMAPEQTSERWREVGPWTDLFSLGRLAEALLGEMPPPEGLDAWLARLMAPEPGDRFQRAADAAYALEQLLPPSEDAPIPASSPGIAPLAPITVPITLPHRQHPASMAVAAADSVTPGHTPSHRAEQTWSSGFDVLPLLTAAPQAAPMLRQRPPLPTDWRTLSSEHGATPAGLSLLGQRSLPTIGRAPEQDRLWAALRAVDRGAMRLCMIEGAAGTGKQRLTRWLAERAHEAGAATVMTARHTERSSNELGRMLAASLGCVGLDRDVAAARIEAMLRRQGISDPYEWQGLMELIAPSGEVRFKSPAEPYALIQRHLERATRERLVVLRLEDVQWGSDAVGLARHLARTRRPLPVLVLLTWAPTPDQPVAIEQIQALLRAPEVTRLRLEPLPDTQQRRLCREALGLHPTLAAHVAAGTAGVPLFAVQLVQHWADRGLLVQTPAGLAVPPSAPPPPVPATLEALWLERVDRVLARLGIEQRTAAELAAVLDGPIDPTEWRTACSHAGLDPRPELVDLLLERGLARCPPQGPSAGWSFIHWTLREALERRAAQAGRMRALHRACAWIIAERLDPSLALRLARHLVDAGEEEAALDPLYQASSRLILQGNYRQGEVLLMQRGAIMDRLGLTPGDPRRISGLLLISHLAQATRDLRRAEEVALTTQSIAERPADRVRALQQLCRIRREQGRLIEARDLARQAQVQAEPLSRPILIAHCHRDQASILLLEGELARSEAAYARALELYDAAGDSKGAAVTHQGLGRIYTRQRRWDEATHHIERSRDLHRALHERTGEAACLNALGEIARLSGDLPSAAACYRAALDILRGTSDTAESIAEINLALVQVALQAYPEADRALSEQLLRCEQRGQRAIAGLLHAYRLPGLVWGARWLDATHAALAARHLSEETGVRDPDAARFSEQAAGWAARAGQADLAQQITAIAVWHQS